MQKHCGADGVATGEQLPRLSVPGFSALQSASVRKQLGPRLDHSHGIFERQKIQPVTMLR